MFGDFVDFMQKLQVEIFPMKLVCGCDVNNSSANKIAQI